MKFTVKPALLHEAISEVAKAAGNAKTFPVLGGVCIEAESGKVTLSATGLETAISRTIEAEVSEVGAGVVPAKPLAAVVSRLAALDSLSLAWDTTKDSVRLTWPRGKAQFAGFPPDQFPAIVEATGNPITTLPAQRWRDILRRTGFAASEDRTRPYLCGVYLSLTPAGEGGMLTATATDSVRIAHLRQEIASPVELYSVILSAAGVRALLATLPDDASPASLYDVGNSVVFVCGERVISARKLDGQYPDIMRLVPQRFGIQVTANRRSLLEAIGRVVIVSPAAHMIKLEITAEALTEVLTVSAKSESDSADDSIDVMAVGETPFTIGFNASYVVEGLRAMSEESVTLQFSDARNPARILDGDSESFQYIVLPLITY